MGRRDDSRRLYTGSVGVAARQATPGGAAGVPEYQRARVQVARCVVSPPQVVHQGGSRLLQGPEKE